MMKQEDRKRIYILRHCRTSFNVDGRISGGEDVPILKGNVELPGENRQLKNYIIITSPLTRCLQTVRIFQKSNAEPAFDIISDSRLVERNMGDMTGHYRKDMLEKYPKYFFQNRKFNPLLTPPNGESFPEFSSRVSQFIVDLEKWLKECDKNIMICSHNQTLKMFYALAYREEVQEIWGKVNFANGKVVPLEDAETMIS